MGPSRRDVCAADSSLDTVDAGARLVREYENGIGVDESPAVYWPDPGSHLAATLPVYRSAGTTGDHLAIRRYRTGQAIGTAGPAHRPSPLRHPVGYRGRAGHRIPAGRTRTSRPRRPSRPGARAGERMGRYRTVGRASRFRQYRPGGVRDLRGGGSPLPRRHSTTPRGYLLAAGVIDALAARMVDGIGRDVRVSLARTASWLPAAPERTPAHPLPAPPDSDVTVAHGRIRTAAPALAEYPDYLFPLPTTAATSPPGFTAADSGWSGRHRYRGPRRTPPRSASFSRSGDRVPLRPRRCRRRRAGR